MKETLRYILGFIIGSIIGTAIFTSAKQYKEEKKEEKHDLLWQVDEGKKYTDSKPGLVSLLKNTPSYKTLYAIDANEEAESYFGLYLVTDSAGVVSSKLLFMARSVEQLQEAAESFHNTSTR